LNAEDGSLIWNYSLGTIDSYPVVADGRLFFGLDSGHVFLALNSTNGHNLWNYTALSVGKEEVASVANGVVYLGIWAYNPGDDSLYALNATTGEAIWKVADDVNELPCISNGVIYSVTDGAKAYAFDAATGSKLWYRSLYEDNMGSQPNLAVQNNTVYARNEYNKLYALNAKDGGIKWRVTFDGYISAPTVVNSVVYEATDKALYALSAYDGRILWNYSSGSGFNPAVVDKGVVYISDAYDSEERQIYAISIPAPPTQVTLVTASDVEYVAIAAVIVTVAISAGLLVYYFKKRKN